MTFRIFGLCALFLFTAGCSSVHSLLSFDKAPAAAEPAAFAAPPPELAAPSPDDFCARVAASTHAQAAADGFDAATQTRMTQESFQQCAAMGQRG
jgi:hypothetical protein